MTFSQGETACDQLLRAVEIDDADIGPSMDEDVAIGALQRRTGDDPRLVPGEPFVDPGGDGHQLHRIYLELFQMREDGRMRQGCDGAAKRSGDFRMAHGETAHIQLVD